MTIVTVRVTREIAKNAKNPHASLGRRFLYVVIILAYRLVPFESSHPVHGRFLALGSGTAAYCPCGTCAVDSKRPSACLKRLLAAQ